MANAKLLRIGSPFLVGTSPAFTNTAIDASTKGNAVIFQALTADPITHLGWRYGARTGTPPTYITSLQSVTSTAGGGVPSGTVLGGGSPASVTFTPPADTSIDGLFQWYALANSYTPAIGDVLAACIEYSSGTISGAANSSFTQTMSGAIALGRPYTATKSTTWTKSGGNAQPVFGYRTASGRFGYPVQSSYTTATATTSGHRSGMKFALPGTSTTYKARGLRSNATWTGDNNLSLAVKIWNGAGSAVQSLTVDTDQIGRSNGYPGVMEIVFSDSLGTLTGGTSYYVGLECAGGSNSGVSARSYGFADANDAAAMAGGGDYLLSTYNGSAWTDDATCRPMMELILEDITEPSGGSGGSLILGLPF